MIAAAARLRRLLARRRCPLCRARVPDVEAHLGLYHTAAEQRQADERTKP